MSVETMPFTKNDFNEMLVDADGHIYEPADLWEKYIDPKYRDRAIRFLTNDQGKQFVEVNGKPSRTLHAGVLAATASMVEHGKLGEEKIRELNSERRRLLEGATQVNEKGIFNSFTFDFFDGTYEPNRAPGACDSKQRIEHSIKDGVTNVILYPTLGLAWPADVQDPEISHAYAVAYNRWIADFCRDSSGRLVPIAHMVLGDAKQAARELERAVKDGCKGGFLVPHTTTRKPHGHPDHDALFAAAQDLDVPIALHPGPDPAGWGPFHRYDGIEWSDWYFDVLAIQKVQQAFASMFAYGVFDRFPRLKFVVVEATASWIAGFLRRCDTVYEGSIMGSTVLLKEKPSFYFNRQIYITADTDELTTAEMMRLTNEDNFFWGSDYPHVDHSANYMGLLHGAVERMTPTARRKFLGANAKKVFKL